MAKPTNTLPQGTVRATSPSSTKLSNNFMPQRRPEPGCEPPSSEKSTTREAGVSNKTTMMSIKGIKRRLRKNFSPDEGEPNTKTKDSRDLMTRSIRLSRTGIQSRGETQSVKLT